MPERAWEIPLDCNQGCLGSQEHFLSFKEFEVCWSARLWLDQERTQKYILKTCTITPVESIKSPKFVNDVCFTIIASRTTAPKNEILGFLEHSWIGCCKYWITYRFRSRCCLKSYEVFRILDSWLLVTYVNGLTIINCFSIWSISPFSSA